MADIVHNAIRASYPIWIMCDKCNERVELVRARSCIEDGEYITVIDINHKCKEKEKASTLTKERIPIAYQKLKLIEIEKGVYTAEITDIRKKVK